METKLIKGVPTSKEDAVLDNMGIVRKVAFQYRRKAKQAGIEFEDLENIGAIGLMKAFDDFDESRQLQFSTYAYPKVLAEISRTIQLGYDKEVRFPVNIKETAAKIIKFQLEEESAEVIASRFGLTHFRVETALDYLNTPMSIRLDSEYRSKSQGEFMPVYDLVGYDPDLTNVFVQEFMSTLSEKEKDVVVALLCGTDRGVITRRWGNHRARFGQVLAKVKKKLTIYLEDEHEAVKI